MSKFQLSNKPLSKVLSLEQIHLSKENRIKINQLIEEVEYIDELKKYDLPVDNKVLLYGSTGCGKTATANAIAKKLNKKIITLHLSEFVSSRLGETAKNIAEVFRNAKLEKAILFIDEFDFIGKSRDEDSQDSGEMRRLVNALLQEIDSMKDTTILIGATNYIEVIDVALLRRFQLKLSYGLPNRELLDLYYDDILKTFPLRYQSIDRKYDISYAEAKDLAFQQVKKKIIEDEKNKKSSQS